MYQSEMARLEKSGAVDNSGAIVPKISTKSWGRRYVEDYATAVQLVFGLLCGLAMLLNNFIRLYAEEPEHLADEFPTEIDTRNRLPVRRPELAPKTTTRGDIVDDTRSQQKTTQAKIHPGLLRLRETLKLIAFAHPPGHFKVDLKPELNPDYLIIRRMLSNRGDESTTHSVRAKLSLLDDAVRMEPGAFRTRLENFLRQNSFEI